MGGLEIREIECFLALAEELHFGRAGERLYVSGTRVSQLLSALERRIGARLVERTSRRVALTPLGERFLAELRPAYAALRETIEAARAAARGISGKLRIGFQGTSDERLLRAIAAFESAHPGVTTEVSEIPLADPFGPLRRGEVDAAVVLLPMAEPDLVLGPVFPPQRQTLAVSVRHPFAGREALTADDIAVTDAAMIAPDLPAPEYWRRAQAPTNRPGPRVRTLQEGLGLVAAQRGVMLLCRPTAEYHGRWDIAFVPVTGLPDSMLGLVTRRDHAEAPHLRAFTRTVRELTGGRVGV
ncbi:LysR family transcriptional regulator [Streptomyces litchfieldiae]|uniref:LysR family transcriptional regulator n=1 Tax=Streptomyces litchfieldiae TaxID=3075543 RepID=A0ABU2MP25_9ACTN|nr:LysR family transcriptional regulator [Streptomyces sp. DSM 44938]MDT0343137.1 LysR family transcriptional regulator [Streptomyces sp. DSM 44938]